jgi:hypothetical protein
MFDCGSQRQKALADKNRLEKTLKVGDKVLLSTKYLNLKHSKKFRKLLPKCIGPFEVVQVVEPVAYRLTMNPGWRVHPVFHVLLLEPYRESGREQPPPPLVEMEGALEYEVESVLEHRFPKAYYKVAWKGYGIEHNSWEPESNVVNPSEVWRIIGNGKPKSRQGLERFCMLSKMSERYRCACAPHNPSE